MPISQNTLFVIHILSASYRNSMTLKWFSKPVKINLQNQKSATSRSLFFFFFSAYNLWQTRWRPDNQRNKQRRRLCVIVGPLDAPAWHQSRHICGQPRRGAWQRGGFDCFDPLLRCGFANSSQIRGLWDRQFTPRLLSVTRPVIARNFFLFFILLLFLAFVIQRRGSGGFVDCKNNKWAAIFGHYILRKKLSYRS